MSITDTSSGRRTRFIAPPMTGAVFPGARIGAASADFVAAVRRAVGELAGTRWPAPAQPLVDALIGAHRSNIAHTPSPVAIPPAGRRAWTIAWVRRWNAAGPISHRVRYVLGLPDIDLGHR